MYRLYHKIPKGLDPVANVFKQVSYFLLIFLPKQSSYSCFLVKLLALVHLMVSFLQHITAEGTALVQQAEDAATNQVKYLDLNFLTRVTVVMALLLTHFYISVILFLQSYCA